MLLFNWVVENLTLKVFSDVRYSFASVTITTVFINVVINPYWGIIIH